MFSIDSYNIGFREAWDNFVRCARNATFLHERNYMDYHADRFTDASLMIFRDRKLCAVFPANAEGDTIYSHRGLSYGGLILDRDVHVTDVEEILDVILKHYKNCGYKHLIVRMPPYIYHDYCADDLLYWLHRAGGILSERNISSCIDLDAPLPFSTLRRRHVKRALKNGLHINWIPTNHIESMAPDAVWRRYWEILTEVLDCYHQAKPVHSIDEILFLRSRFPLNIQVVTVENTDGKLLAGTVLYISNKVVHVQYIASCEEGRACGAVDLLFDRLVNHYAAHGTQDYNTRVAQGNIITREAQIHDANALTSPTLLNSITTICKSKPTLSRPRYFDLGTSMADGGPSLNEGLVFQKEGYGARSVVYDTYSLVL